MLSGFLIPKLDSKGGAVMRIRKVIIAVFVLIVFSVINVEQIFSQEDLSSEINVVDEELEQEFKWLKAETYVNTLIENPESVKLGGEKRSITIMITDLRGFTALSERLDPEQVVRMLNSYFEVMLDVVHQYHGTLNEIVGIPC
jgi:hypothetical protein